MPGADFSNPRIPVVIVVEQRVVHVEQESDRVLGLGGNFEARM
jgi:hypothetical protein